MYYLLYYSECCVYDAKILVFASYADDYCWPPVSSSKDNKIPPIQAVDMEHTKTNSKNREKPPTKPKFKTKPAAELRRNKRTTWNKRKQNNNKNKKTVSMETRSNKQTNKQKTRQRRVNARNKSKTHLTVSLCGSRSLRMRKKFLPNCRKPLTKRFVSSSLHFLSIPFGTGHFTSAWRPLPGS